MRTPLLIVVLGCGCRPEPPLRYCTDLRPTLRADGCEVAWSGCSDGVDRTVMCATEGDTLACTCQEDGVEHLSFFSDDLCTTVETENRDLIRTASNEHCFWKLEDAEAVFAGTLE